MSKDEMIRTAGTRRRPRAVVASFQISGQRRERQSPAVATELTPISPATLRSQSPGAWSRVIVVDDRVVRGTPLVPVVE
jgi:hypothetical protein